MVVLALATALSSNLIGTTNGASGSQAFPLQFTSWGIFWSTTNPVSAEVTVENLSTQNITGVLFGFANDSYDHSFSSASTSLKVPANSTGTGDLLFRGTANMSACFFGFTFVVLAPNGTQLSERNQVDVPCRPQFPVGQPNQTTLGVFPVLSLNVTNVAPFQLTMIVILDVINSTSGAIVWVSTATVVVPPGQSAPAYPVTMPPCGNYTALLTVETTAGAALATTYLSPISVC